MKTNEAFKNGFYCMTCSSYIVFSVKILATDQFIRLCGDASVTIGTVLFYNSMLGSGLRLYQSRTLKKASEPKKILYSLYGSMMFNFGSVLFWGCCKRLLPRNVTLRALFGTLSACFLLIVGRDFLLFTENNCS
ncbi:uncharacterized protein LOC134265560 [Saccostrea cucullata]|uniref:uncharacterized protein LOC134265560 n=1 Tax=Saccostrea cuccullata TaxID=36930 RepID=UPI002ED0A677